jgi:hypothetical protein
MTSAIVFQNPVLRLIFIPLALLRCLQSWDQVDIISGIVWMERKVIRSIPNTVYVRPGVRFRQLIDHVLVNHAGALEMLCVCSYQGVIRRCVPVAVDRASPVERRLRCGLDSRLGPLLRRHDGKIVEA